MVGLFVPDGIWCIFAHQESLLHILSCMSISVSAFFWLCRKTGEMTLGEFRENEILLDRFMIGRSFGWLDAKSWRNGLSPYSLFSYLFYCLHLAIRRETSYTRNRVADLCDDQFLQVHPMNPTSMCSWPNITLSPIRGSRYRGNGFPWNVILGYRPEPVRRCRHCRSRR